MSARAAFRAIALASAGILAGCAGMDSHRTACAALLGRAGLPATGADKPVEGGPVAAPEGAKPAPLDPAVEQCAQGRADAERREVAAGILLGLAAGIAGASAGASYRSAYRPSYRPAYRTTYAPSYRSGWRR